MYLKFSIQKGAFLKEVESIDGWVRKNEGTNTGKLLPVRDVKCNENTDDVSSISVAAGTVSIRCAFSGEDQIYYAINNNCLYLSDSNYRIASEISAPLDIVSCYEFIYFEHPVLDRTLYKNVFQIKNAARVIFSVDGNKRITVDEEDFFSIPDNEFDTDDAPALAKGLREKINDAFQRRAGASNLVLLSGGIDSQVMAIALHRDLGISDVGCLTFYVKGGETEVDDAKAAAKGLNLDWTPVAVDPNAEIDLGNLVHENSPFLGFPLMHQLLLEPRVAAMRGATMFAGQDTRLHTPSLNGKDHFLWSHIYSSAIRSQIVASSAKLGRAFFSRSDESCYLRRFFDLFSNSPTFSDFLANRYFHVRRFPFNEDGEIFQNEYRQIKENLSSCSPNKPRATYNQIVKLN
jgi:hypothetical protein